MALLATTAETADYVHTSDSDVSIDLPDIVLPILDADGSATEDTETIAAPPQWIPVGRVAELGGSVALGATVVSVRPLNGADYYRCQAMMPPLEDPTSEERARYGEALEAICNAGVADVHGFDGGKSQLVRNLRADHLDALASVILRASRGRSV